MNLAQIAAIILIFGQAVAEVLKLMAKSKNHT